MIVYLVRFLEVTSLSSLLCTQEDHHTSACTSVVVLRDLAPPSLASHGLMSFLLPACRLPPVIQQLQRAQQRAHDELEAAEKEACHYRAPAEAGERFVTNARKHKAKLDVPVYEHGREVNARSMKR